MMSGREPVTPTEEYLAALVASQERTNELLAKLVGGADDPQGLPDLSAPVKRPRGRPRKTPEVRGD